MDVVQQHPLAVQPVAKLLAKFAVPGVIALLVNSLYNIVDQIFIGRDVGFLGNGATNIVFPITVIALGFAILIGDGAAAYLSLKLGQNDRDAAARGIGNALIMLTLAGIAFMVFFLLLLEPACMLFGATDLLLPYALEYGGIIVIGLPFMMIGTGINSIIRADGAPAYAMKTMLVGAVINVVLDAVFIFGLHWGMFGAALATIIGQVATFAMATAYLRKCKSIKLCGKSFKLKARAALTVLSLGVSSFISQLAIMIIMVVINNFLVYYGALSHYGAEIPITVLGIVMKIVGILTGILIGISVGAQPILGYNYGAGNYDRVRQTYLLTVKIATAVSLVSFTLFYCCPQTLISIFGAESDLYNEFAVKAFRIFLMMTVTYGFMMASGVFLQAIGKPLMATIVSLSRQIIFFMPAIAILPGILGLDGVLWAGATADGLAFVLVMIIMVLQIKYLGKPREVSLKSRAANALIPQPQEVLAAKS